jgi:hypothetical protein
MCHTKYIDILHKKEFYMEHTQKKQHQIDKKNYTPHKNRKHLLWQNWHFLFDNR